MYTQLIEYLPPIASFAALVLVLWLANYLLLARRNIGAEAKLPRQLLMLLLTVAALVLFILIIPMSDTSRGQVLSLLGVLLTGVVAISSTTIVANVLAGMMLRVIASFKPGDFVRIGEQFGRVTNRGLLHIEIQTEDRDLTTLPNLYLITNPVTVVHRDGTMISASLSLGYDISRVKIEKLLCQAAEETGLQEPFVFVNELGDYSISYKVAGFLGEVKQLLTTKSNLRKNIIDVLHDNDVEIVSPSFMNQRRLPDREKVIPDSHPPIELSSEGDDDSTAEELIFDKADKAAELDSLRKELSQLSKQIEKDNDTEEHMLEHLKQQFKTSKQRVRELEKELNSAKTEEHNKED